MLELTTCASQPGPKAGVSQPRSPTILDIAEYLKLRDQIASLGEDVATITIRRPASVEEAGEADITFINVSGRRGLELLQATSATLALVPQKLAPTPARRAATVALGCTNPRLAFVRTLNHFFAAERPSGIHPRAVVDARANIATSAYVGPLATVAQNVRIGERTVVHAGAHVYAGCTIGEDCTIHSGAVIGADGFGYERNEDGVPERFPQLGTVVIEDGVEIGANSCIDRAALGATVIRSHARIDDMVYIAHNVEVGRGALLVAMTMVAGGARLGDLTYIGPS